MGEKLSKSEKDSYASIYRAGKSSDTCSLFFFACLSALKENGHLGLLLPEAFFNIAAYETARRASLDRKIERLIDYEKPFKGLLTRAQALLLNTKFLENTAHRISCEFRGSTHIRTTETFKKNPKAILNFYCTSDDLAVIDHIFSIPHITIKGKG